MAQYNLERQGFEIFLPLIEQEKHRAGYWVKVIEALFPQYLFIRLGMGHDNISSIRSTLGVRDLVRFNNTPALVPEPVVESIRSMLDESSGIYRVTTPLFKKGDPVRIDQSPFTGIPAIFLAETGNERVAILINLLGQDRRVTVERDMLRLA
jgi:transcriptional antiterminator RfaH